MSLYDMEVMKIWADDADEIGTSEKSCDDWQEFCQQALYDYQLPSNTQIVWQLDGWSEILFIHDHFYPEEPIGIRIHKKPVSAYEKNEPLDYMKPISWRTPKPKLKDA